MLAGSLDPPRAPPTVGVNTSVMFDYVPQHHTVPPRANTLGLRLPGLVTVLNNAIHSFIQRADFTFILLSNCTVYNLFLNNLLPGLLHRSDYQRQHQLPPHVEAHVPTPAGYDGDQSRGAPRSRRFGAPVCGVLPQRLPAHVSLNLLLNTTEPCVLSSECMSSLLK